MTLQATKTWDILELVQVCVQVFLLWIPWLVKFARTSRSPTFVWAVGLPILILPAAVPVACFITALFIGRYDLLVGLGSTISTFEISVAMTFVTMVCLNQVFKPEPLNGEVEHRGRMFCLAVSGFVMLILAIIVAGLERREVGIALAGLGLSCVQSACLLWADGQEAKGLLVFASTILVAEVLSLLVCLLVALLGNNFIHGFDETSKCVYGLSLLGLWGQAVFYYHKELLNWFSRARNIIGIPDLDKSLLPIASDSHSQRSRTSVINLNSFDSEEGEAHRISREHLFQVDLHSSRPVTPFSQPAGVHDVGHSKHLLPAPQQSPRSRQFSRIPISPPPAYLPPPIPNSYTQAPKFSSRGVSDI